MRGSIIEDMSGLLDFVKNRRRLVRLRALKMCLEPVFRSDLPHIADLLGVERQDAEGTTVFRDATRGVTRVLRDVGLVRLDWTWCGQANPKLHFPITDIPDEGCEGIS